jgi:hypothetical protein
MKKATPALILLCLISTFVAADTTIYSPNGSRPVSRTLFGVHSNGLPSGTVPWPGSAIGSYRTWDSGAVWSNIQKSRGSYNWKRLDQIVSAMSSHGVSVLFDFGRTPAWASSAPWKNCGGGAGQCMPPYSMTDWGNWVRAVVTRYRGRIKYYELWNEPDAWNWWSGATPQMVQMARVAYPIIKSIDPGAIVVSPAPQGLYAFRWMDGFFAGGGASYVDVIAFHGYVTHPGGFAAAPETWVTIANNMRNTMNKYHVNKPLIDTELSWAENWKLPSSSAQAAFVARIYMMHWLHGVNLAFWDVWDGGIYGTLYTNHLLAGGKAYTSLSSWLVGAAFDRCIQYSNGTWACHLSRSGGYHGWIVWNVHGNTSYQLNAADNLKRQRTLSGGQATISPGSKISIGTMPVLVEGVGGGSNSTAGGGGGGSNDFATSATPDSATVSAGKSAKFTLKLAPTAKFNATVSLSCTGAPSGVACTPSAKSVTLKGNQTANVTFAISVSPGVTSATNLPWGGGLIWTLATALFLPMFFHFERSPRRGSARRATLAWTLLVVALTIGMASCGGVSANPQGSIATTMQRGTFTVILHAVSGSLDHSKSVTLTVR